MIKTAPTQLRKWYNAYIQAQKQNGYPDFKNRIVRVLVDEYNISHDVARQLVFSDRFHQEIVNDIHWAQHMGSEYWAERLFEEHFHKTVAL